MSLDLTALMNLASTKPVELEKVSVKRYNKECKNGDFKILKNGSIIYSEAFRRELAVEVNEVDKATGEVTGTKTVYRFMDFASGNNPKFLGGNGKGFIFGAILPYGAKTASIQGHEGDGETKVTFIKDELIPMLTEVYGINFEEVKEVEMSFLWDKPVAPAANGKHYIPRVAKNGIDTYVVRDGVTLMPCVPTSMLPATTVVEEVKADIEQLEILFPAE